MLPLLFLRLLFACACCSQVHSMRRNLSSCIRPPYEAGFHTIVAALFSEGIMPDGDILDIGAHNGDLSCFYGCLERRRVVHAVDPNRIFISRLKCPTPNIRAHNYAMSDDLGWIDFNPASVKSGFVGSLEDKRSNEGNVEIVTLSEFFARQNSRPGFLHIDVEGYELNLIRGGLDLLRAQRPIFSFETFINNLSTMQTIREVEKLDYCVYMVNEICGLHEDCRNMLAVPVEKVTKFKSSWTVQIGVLTDFLVHVTSSKELSQSRYTLQKTLPWKYTRKTKMKSRVHA